MRKSETGWRAPRENELMLCSDKKKSVIVIVHMYFVMSDNTAFFSHSTVAYK